MDAIDKELVLHNSDRFLSPQLIGRITSLSIRLKPYAFLEGDTLIEKPLSPERGQLLINLLESNLKKSTYDKLFEKAKFSYADLEEVKFSANTYLYRVMLENANLKGAILARSNLIAAELSNSDLSKADLYGTDLTKAVFYNTILRETNLNSTILLGLDFNNCDLQGAKFNSTIIRGVEFTKSNLKNAKLDYALIDDKNWISNLEINKDSIIGVKYIQENYFIDTTTTIIRKTTISPTDTFYRIIPIKIK